MANTTIRLAIFVLCILLYSQPSESFKHRFRYLERKGPSQDSPIDTYLKMWSRGGNSSNPKGSPTRNPPFPTTNSTFGGNSTIGGMGGNSTIKGNSTTPGMTPGKSKFSTPGQSPTPKSPLNSMKHSPSGSPGTSSPTSNPISPKSHPSASSAQGSSPTSKPGSGKNPTGSSHSSPASKSNLASQKTLQSGTPEAAGTSSAQGSNSISHSGYPTHPGGGSYGASTPISNPASQKSPQSRSSAAKGLASNSQSGSENGSHGTSTPGSNLASQNPSQSGASAAKGFTSKSYPGSGGSYHGTSTPVSNPTSQKTPESGVSAAKDLTSNSQSGYVTHSGGGSQGIATQTSSVDSSHSSTTSDSPVTPKPGSDSTAQDSTHTTRGDATSSSAPTSDTNYNKASTTASASITDTAAATNAPSMTDAPSAHGGKTSGTELPDSEAASTVSEGPSETSDAIIFPVIFGNIHKNKDHVLDDDKHKTDFSNQIQSAKSQVKSYLNDLPDKPDTSDVQCGSGKHKRSLISDIAGLAGSVVKLVTCADQVLDNLDNVVKEDHPSTKDIDTLTDAIDVIGKDIDTAEKEDDDNKKTTAKESAQSTHSDPSTSKPSSTQSSTSSTSEPASTTSTASTSHSTSTSTPSSTTKPTSTSTPSSTTKPTSTSTPSTTKPTSTTTPSTTKPTSTTTPSTTKLTSTSTPSTTKPRSTTSPSTSKPTSTTTPSTTSPKSSKTTRSSSESQSTCTQTAVSRCTEFVSLSTSYFASRSGSTVFTSTTKECFTVSACLSTATTVITTISGTPTPTPTNQTLPQLILRNFKNNDQAAIAAFEKQLEEQVGKGNFNTTRASPAVGIVFWSARLNSSQIQEFNKSSVVSDIVENEKINITAVNAIDQKMLPPSYLDNGTQTIFKRANNDLVSQLDAGASLRVVSQPKNVSLIDLVDDYKYRAVAGEGVTVYVVDTGVNAMHPEYWLALGEPRWLWPVNPALPEAPPETMTDEFGHGTCIFSKIAGLVYGVAKRVDTVIVKTALQMSDDYMYLEAALETWAAINADIALNNLQGRAVINFSAGMTAYLGDTPPMQHIIYLLEMIIKQDVPIVCPSGNNGQDTPIEHLPATLANQLDGLIVVGATDYDGRIASFSQIGNVVSVFAPGVDVLCAGNIQDYDTLSSGTSQATAIVSGLAAYFLSLDKFQDELQVPGQVAKNVRDLIKRLAYSRNGGPPVIWNEESGDSCINLHRRDGSSNNICTHPWWSSSAPASASSSTSSSASASASASASTVASASTAASAAVSASASTSTPVSASSGVSTAILISTKAAKSTASTPSFTKMKTATTPPPITSCALTTAPAKTISGLAIPAASFCTCNNGWIAGIGSTVGPDYLTTYTCQLGTTTTMAMTTVTPTNRPGVGGLPACAAVPATTGTSAHCICDGTTCPTLPPTASGLLNCHYTILPTAAWDPVIPVTTTAYAYATGACGVHVYEGLGALTADPAITFEVNVTDANGKQIGFHSGNLDWGDSFEVDSELPWVLLLNQSTGNPKDDGRNGKDHDGIYRVRWEDGPLVFKYAAQTWDLSSDNCSVGLWDNGNFGDAWTDYESNRQIDCSFNCP